MIRFEWMQNDRKLSETIHYNNSIVIHAQRRAPAQNVRKKAYAKEENHSAQIFPPFKWDFHFG